MSRWLAAALSLGVVACAAPAVRSTPTPVPESRFYDTRANGFVSFATLVEAAAAADVVFFGEQHDDPATHRAELALLAAIGSKRPKVVVSLEMFERDVQPTLDAYLAGEMSEADFMAKSRPWARYTTDYRALVELARAHGWRVIAANVPRPLASAVSRTGLAALDTLSEAQRGYVARERSCPRDAYFERFASQMTGHSGTGPASANDSSSAAAATFRFYEAQCLKDETMGESIAVAYERAGAGAIVVHFNGAFHTDMGFGTAARVRRRLPNAKTLLVTAVPVADPARADTAGFAGRADFVVVTRRAPAPPKQ